MANVIYNLIGQAVIVGIAGFLLWNKISGMHESIKELYGKTNNHESRICVIEKVCDERHSGGGRHEAESV